MRANAELDLVFKQRKDGRTYISDQFFKLPLQVFPTCDNETDGTTFLYLLNPSGGMLENDVFKLDFTLCQGAKAVITTPSSNKIYRCESGRRAYQRLDVCVEKDAVLEYIPEHSVPYRNSSFEQENVFRIARFGTLFTWDILMPGRITCGEFFDFSSYSSLFEIYYDDKLLIREKNKISPEHVHTSSCACMRYYKLSAVCYYVTEKISDALKENVLQLFIKNNNDIYGGISMPCENLAVIKILANDISSMKYFLFELWNCLRQTEFDKKAFRIRKY